MPKENAESPNLTRRRNESTTSNPDVSPASSMARLTSYEDDQSLGNVGLGGSRIRNDSLSTSCGVRFDADGSN